MEKKHVLPSYGKMVLLWQLSLLNILSFVKFNISTVINVMDSRDIGNRMRIRVEETEILLDCSWIQFYDYCMIQIILYFYGLLKLFDAIPMHGHI